MEFFNKFYHWSFAIILLVTFLYFGSSVLSCANGIDESKLQEICERENNCEKIGRTAGDRGRNGEKDR